jgi:hypothetical protein
MTGLLETIALRHLGFSDPQIADLMGTLPDFEHLAGVLKAELPRIQRMMPDVLHLLQVVQAELPRASKLTPVVQMAIGVIKQHEQESA